MQTVKKEANWKRLDEMSWAVEGEEVDPASGHSVYTCIHGSCTVRCYPADIRALLILEFSTDSHPYSNHRFALSDGIGLAD
jgi:hypothetical protein